jgi:hypothetical protein
MQPTERLHLAHHLAAGGVGLEHLPEETFAGQAQAEDPRETPSSSRIFRLPVFCFLALLNPCFISGLCPFCG